MVDIYHVSPPPLRVDPGFSPKQWAIQTDTNGMIIGIVVAPELEDMARVLFLAEHPPVDHRALCVKLLRATKPWLTANKLNWHQDFTDTEWAELQRLAGEAPR